MARKSQDLKRIESRREEIAARMSAIETELEKLRSEDLDLAVAARVIERLAATDAEQLEALEGLLAAHAEKDDGADAALEKTLTIGEMAMTLLHEAPDGLSANDMLAAIRERWLPALMRTSLSPPLSRLKQKGEIYIDDGRWKVVSKNEASDEF